MKYLRRKCESCRQVFDVRKDWKDRPNDNMIVWQTCPFAEEIHDDYTKMWLCESCAYEAAMDI